MIKKCPNGKIHFNKYCKCVDKNHFIYHNGKWMLVNNYLHIINSKHNMFSWTGQLSNNDFVYDILKNIFGAIIISLIIIISSWLIVVKNANKLKDHENKIIFSQSK